MRNNNHPARFPRVISATPRVKAHSFRYKIKFYKPSVVKICLITQHLEYELSLHAHPCSFREILRAHKGIQPLNVFGVPELYNTSDTSSLSYRLGKCDY